MTDEDFKRIREAGKVPAKQYTDRHGKRRCVGTKDLKATQCCPYSITLKPPVSSHAHMSGCGYVIQLRTYSAEFADNLAALHRPDDAASSALQGATSSTDADSVDDKAEVVTYNIV